MGQSEVWGSECASNPLTGKSASFRLRFRFVSCVRAGEAKLRGRVRDVILNAGPPGSQDRLVPFRADFLPTFADRRAGFNGFWPKSLGSRC